MSGGYFGSSDHRYINPLQNDVPADPPGGHPVIEYLDHQANLARMLAFFPG